MKSVALACVLVLAACADRPASPRTLVLWAWDRAEDLRFAAGVAEVAALMETVYLREGKASSSLRRLPLILPEGTKPIAVVRMESDGTSLPPIRELAARFERWRDYPMLQIDFDARSSQIEWYGQLLTELARQQPVSITALASWCLDKPWFDGLTSEAVPMLYAMGPQRNAILDRLRRRGQFAAGCRDSLGVSTAEPLVWLPETKRVWIFHPRPWTREAFDEALARLR